MLVETEVRKPQTAFAEEEKNEDSTPVPKPHTGTEEEGGKVDSTHGSKQSKDDQSEEGKEVWVPPSREKSELSTTTTTSASTNESSESSETTQSNSEQSKLSVGLPALASIGATAAPTDESYEPSVYHIKWNTFDLRDVPIITQNENGPCPLLAIMNILLLKGKVKLEPGQEIITPEQIMTYLGDSILENAPKVFMHVTIQTKM